MDAEMKTVIDELGTGYKALRDELDQHGKTSGEAKQAIEKINKSIDGLEAIKEARDEQAQRVEALEAKHAELMTSINRIGDAIPVSAPEKAAEYRKKLNAFIRGGEAFDAKGFGSEHGLVVSDGAMKGFTLDLKLLSTDSGPDGGYMVSNDHSGRTVMTEFPSSPMRAIASVQQTNKPILDGLYDGDEPSTQETGERAGGSNDTTPEVGIWEVPVANYRCNLPATQNMLDDSDRDMAAWLQDKGRSAMFRDQNADFISGTGTVKGILSYAAGTIRGTVEQITTIGSSTIDWKDLAGIVDEVKDEYLTPEACYLVNRKTRGVMRILVDDNNRPLWEPSLIAGTPARYNGFNVYSAEDMPTCTGASANNTFADGVLPVAFGNFRRGYQIAERAAFDVLVDPYTQHPAVVYKMVSRAGGRVINFEAFKILKIKAA